jgi:type I restriction enzyme, S subunit
VKNEELEIKNKLPTGWVYAGLEDISDVDRHSIKRGPFGSALKKEFFVPDGYKVYEQGNVINNDFNRGTYFINDEKFKNLKSFSIKPKDILMSCAGTVGKLAIVPDGVQEGVINQALLKLSVHADIDLQYFFKLFSYQIDEILKGNLRGSAMMNLTSVKDLKLVKFPIAPINEQKRIVAKIEKLFSNLDNSDKYLLHLEKQLKRYRKSVLKSAFEGEYKKVQWKDIVNIKNGKHYINVLNKNGKYPIYGSSGIINYADEYLCNEDTVIVGRKGTINKPLFIKEKFWNIDTAFGLEADQSKLFPLYLYYFTLSFNFLDLNQSTAIPSLTKSNLQRISMSLPDSIAEQIEIVNEIEKHFSIIDKLEVVVQQSIKESKRLRQSILKQAFEGKLVEQDPNDESASILLEKIAKAKEEYQKAMKRKK